jgi:hypothetical protein
MKFVTAALRLLTMLVVALMLPTAALAELVISPERPLVGQPLTISLADGTPLEGSGSATFAPGTVVPRQLDLQDSSADPGFQWTPDAPGLWDVSVGDASITIVVGREGVPIAGLMVLIVAASSLIFLSLWGLGRKS